MARGKVSFPCLLNSFHPELKCCREDDDSWVRLEELRRWSVEVEKLETDDLGMLDRL